MPISNTLILDSTAISSSNISQNPYFLYINVTNAAGAPVKIEGDNFAGHDIRHILHIPNFYNIIEIIDNTPIQDDEEGGLTGELNICGILSWKDFDSLPAINYNSLSPTNLYRDLNTIEDNDDNLKFKAGHVITLINKSTTNHIRFSSLPNSFYSLLANKNFAIRNIDRWVNSVDSTRSNQNSAFSSQLYVTKPGVILKPGESITVMKDLIGGWSIISINKSYVNIENDQVIEGRKLFGAGIGGNTKTGRLDFWIDSNTYDSLANTPIERGNLLNPDNIITIPSINDVSNQLLISTLTRRGNIILGSNWNSETPTNPTPSVHKLIFNWRVSNILKSAESRAGNSVISSINSYTQGSNYSSIIASQNSFIDTSTGDANNNIAIIGSRSEGSTSSFIQGLGYNTMGILFSSGSNISNSNPLSTSFSNRKIIMGGRLNSIINESDLATNTDAYIFGGNNNIISTNEFGSPDKHLTILNSQQSKIEGNIYNSIIINGLSSQLKHTQSLKSIAYDVYLSGSFEASIFKEFDNININATQYKGQTVIGKDIIPTNNWSTYVNKLTICGLSLVESPSEKGFHHVNPLEDSQISQKTTSRKITLIHTVNKDNEFNREYFVNLLTPAGPFLINGSQNRYGIFSLPSNLYNTADYINIINTKTSPETQLRNKTVLNHIKDGTPLASYFAHYNIPDISYTYKSFESACEHRALFFTTYITTDSGIASTFGNPADMSGGFVGYTLGNDVKWRWTLNGNILKAKLIDFPGHKESGQYAGDRNRGIRFTVGQLSDFRYNDMDGIASFNAIPGSNVSAITHKGISHLYIPMLYIPNTHNLQRNQTRYDRYDRNKIDCYDNLVTFFNEKLLSDVLNGMFHSHDLYIRPNRTFHNTISVYINNSDTGGQGNHHFKYLGQGQGASNPPMDYVILPGTIYHEESPTSLYSDIDVLYVRLWLKSPVLFQNNELLNKWISINGFCEFELDFSKYNELLGNNSLSNFSSKFFSQKKGTNSTSIISKFYST